MKHLIFLFLAGCVTLPLGPKFKMYQSVQYDVPPFYSTVCSGEGKVDTYNSSSGEYSITTPNTEKGCPYRIYLKEENLHELQECK